MSATLGRAVVTNASCKYKVVTKDNKKDWDDYTDRAYIADFYYTHNYHLMDRQGEAFLFVYEQGDNFIAIPLVKRKIGDTDYFDCTSVYGYSGPISNVDFADLSLTFHDRFYSCLSSFLHSEKIVSVFSVLHPLSNQYLLLNRNESLRLIGKTVAIDLRQTLEEQRLQYRRAIRLKINQLRRKGFAVKLADSVNELYTFAEIYRENMTKVGASAKYVFDNKYFEDFMSATDFRTELLLVYYQEEIVAGAMVVFTKNIVQLHLAGTKNEFLKESPMKLIFDEASLIGRAREKHFLHLGSGVEGKEDSLFHFKRGFSDCLFDFTTWCYIVNPKVYNELVLINTANTEKVETNLFPLYRFA